MKAGLLWLAGLAGVLMGASYATHRRLDRQRVASRTHPEPLQRWEGEGGAVPAPLSGELKNARMTSPESESKLDIA